MSSWLLPGTGPAADQAAGQAGHGPAWHDPKGAPAAGRPARRLPGELAALLAIAQRDVLKLLRDRIRLAVNLAFPVLLIGGLGGVLQPVIGSATGLDARTLAFTGVLAATLFQSAAAGLISIAEDRENDFSRELFVTPVWRLTLVSGKIAGETLVSLTQGACIAGFAAAFGIRIGLAQLGLMLAAGAGCCLLGGAFGLATVAALPNQRAAMQVFQFLIIPQYVLGGVLFPASGLPPYLAALSAAMPLRYAVGLLRASYYAGRPGYLAAVTPPPAVDAAVIAVLLVVLLAAGAVIFDYRERSR